MGSTIYDSTGEAQLLFDGVPIRAVKKATFKDKLGTLHTLLKLVYNSVTYDFNETAQGGAVVFANNYTNWEFIAPDDRLDFSGMANMTLGNALSTIRGTLVNNPIPAWDKFAAWVYDTGNYPKDIIANTIAYIAPLGGTVTQITAPDFTTMTSGDFVSFLDVLIKAVGNSDLSASAFKTDDKVFKCVISLYRSQYDYLMSMTFTFRE